MTNRVVMALARRFNRAILGFPVSTDMRVSGKHELCFWVVKPSHESGVR